MSAIRSLMTLAFLAVLGLAACAPIERNHGYVPPDLELAQVVPEPVGATPRREYQRDDRDDRAGATADGAGEEGRR